MSDENVKSAWPPTPRPGTCNVRLLVQDAGGLTSEVSLPCVNWDAARAVQDELRERLARPSSRDPGESAGVPVYTKRDAEALVALALASAAPVQPEGDPPWGRPGSRDHVAIWDAINEYVTTCGGDPSKHVYGNTSRQTAVVKVEDAIKVCARASRTTTKAPR